MRILIVKASSFGDIILALPMLRTLRHAFPAAYLAWVVESPFQDILHGNRDLDRLFVVDTSSVRNTAASLTRTVRQVRADRFDVVVDLQGWIKSQLFCKLSGARSIVGILRKNELGFHILEHGVRARPNTHMVDLFLEVAAVLGAREPQMSFEVPVFDADREYVDRSLAPLFRDPIAKIAILQPGTAWKSKHWSLAKFAAVGRALATGGAYVPVVVWGPGEESDASVVASLIGNGGVLAPPTTIRQLAALMQRSRLYVGTDSGPMHLASALGVPTVGLFGPSAPEYFRPYRQPAVVVRRDLACSPCGKPTCRYKSQECMASIDAPDVLDAINRISASLASTMRRGSLA